MSSTRKFSIRVKPAARRFVLQAHASATEEEVAEEVEVAMAPEMKIGCTAAIQIRRL